MTYTAIALMAVLATILFDVFVVRTTLVARKLFWVSYAIILGFQLIANAVLTGMRVVRYNGADIIGNSTPTDSAPPFIGDGRVAFAPVEDIAFGFALVLLTLSMWVMLGRPKDAKRSRPASHGGGEPPTR